MHGHHHLPPLSWRYSSRALAGLPSQQAPLHGDRSRHLRPQRHHPTAHVHHHAIFRPHKEPQQARLHLLRQTIGLRLLQEPGHNASGPAAAAAPGQTHRGVGIASDRRDGGAGVGGGVKRVGGGRGLWGGGSEAHISRQGEVESWCHQNSALWTVCEVRCVDGFEERFGGSGSSPRSYTLRCRRMMFFFLFLSVFNSV